MKNVCPDDLYTDLPEDKIKEFYREIDNSLLSKEELNQA